MQSFKGQYIRIFGSVGRLEIHRRNDILEKMFFLKLIFTTRALFSKLRLRRVDRARWKTYRFSLWNPPCPHRKANILTTNSFIFIVWYITITFLLYQKLNFRLDPPTGKCEILSRNRRTDREYKLRSAQISTKHYLTVYLAIQKNSFGEENSTFEPWVILCSIDDGH